MRNTENGNPPPRRTAGTTIDAAASSSAAVIARQQGPAALAEADPHKAALTNLEFFYDDWYTFGEDRMFRVFPEELTFMEAHRTCELHSASLASIGSEAENAFVQAILDMGCLRKHVFVQ